jgi:hypothetical protein
MPSARESIALVVLRTFKAQDLLASGGKRRFGDWNRRLAKDLVPYIAAACAQGAIEGRGRGLKDEIASFAQERALFCASVVNDTTAEWVQDESDPFTEARAELIGKLEADNAYNVGFGMALKLRKKKQRWKLGRKSRRSCPDCKSLNGVVRKPGEEFIARSGARCINPPLHPWCDCELEEA